MNKGGKFLKKLWCCAYVGEYKNWVNNVLLLEILHRGQFTLLNQNESADLNIIILTHVCTSTIK